MKIVRNFSFLTLTQIGERLFNFILLIALARYLDVEEYGIYALTVSFVGMFGHLFDGGLNFLLTREIASSGKNDAIIFKKTLSLKLIVGVAVFIGLVLISVIMGYDKRILLNIIIFAFATFIISFSNTFRAVFIAHERMEFEGGLAVLYRFLALAGIVFLLRDRVLFPELMLPYIIAALIILYLSYSLQRIRFPLCPPANSLSISGFKLIREASPFAVWAIMGEIYFNIDSVILSKLADIKTLGNYNAANRLVFAGLLLANGLTLAIYPYFAKMWSGNKVHVYTTFNLIFKLLFLISLPLSFVVSFFAEDIIVLVFGSKFYESGSMLRILVWAMIPLYLYHLTGRTLEAIGEQRFVAKTISFCVVGNILLNIIFIPFYGAKGAAMASVTTSVLLLLIHLVFINNKVGTLQIGDILHKIVVPFAGCVLTLIITAKFFNWMFSAALGFLVYFFILYIRKGIKWDEFEILLGHGRKIYE